MPSISFHDILLKPRKSVVHSRTEISLETYVTRRVKLKVPLVSAAMDSITESEMAIALGEIGALGIIHRFCSIEKQVEEVRKVKSLGLLVGAAIGVGEKELERTDALVQAGTDVFLLDVAHAHAVGVFEQLEKIYKRYPDIELMVGAVATAEAIVELQEKFPQIAGFKVGIGGGSACTTRLMTGCGAPVLTSLDECRKVAKVPLMADGGIRSSGTIVKCLAFGASTAQFGGLFAGCLETPSINGRKVYRGMASREAIIDNGKHKQFVFSEGVAQIVSEKNVSAKEIVMIDLVPGILSGLSYLGVRSIPELHSNPPDYHIVSPLSAQETNTHQWE